jgi:alkylation response protein AidB-like acyl-CoA dehydrogenase
VLDAPLDNFWMKSTYRIPNNACACVEPGKAPTSTVPIEHVERKLDAPTASMAKCWVTDLENKIVDERLQLFGGYGYMSEYPISHMFPDSRVQRIYGGANEIMKAAIRANLVSSAFRT